MYKRIPKAQKGLAKIAKSIKTAKKISNTAKKGAPAIVRKAKGVKSAQKTLSQSGLSGVTPSQLRSQFNELLKQASELSKKKASTKKLALKQKGGAIKKKHRKAARTVKKMMEGPTGIKTPTKRKVKKMAKEGKLGTGLAKAQKGGTIKPPKVKGKEKRRLSQIDRRADRMIKKGADKRTVETMRDKAKMTPGSKIATKGQTKRMVKKMKKSSTKTTPVPTTMAKKQKGGLVERVKRGRKVVGPGGNWKRVRELNKKRKRVAVTRKPKRTSGKRIYG